MNFDTNALKDRWIMDGWVAEWRGDLVREWGSGRLSGRRARAASNLLSYFERSGGWMDGCWLLAFM